MRTDQQHNLERFKDLVESLDAIVWEADAKTLRFSFVSPQAEEMLGYPLERWLEEENFWANLIHPEDREYAVELCETAVKQRRNHEFEYRVVAADGRVVCLRDVVRVVTDRRMDGVTLRGVMIDVTEQRAIEERLRQSQKMEAIGRLAGGVAHDFNNVLGVILNYTDFLRERLDGEPDVVEDLEEIRRAARRAATLTRQLLAFSRKEAASPQVVDLNELIGNMSNLFRRTIGEHIELQLDLHPDLWTVKVDPSHFEQVLVNLVVNARDAMPQGGILQIRTRNIDMLDGSIEHLPDVMPDRYVCLSIIDNGVGMSPEVAARVFEPFFTTKEQGRGTGLGLATAYGIVNRAGGYITVASHLGSGSTFEVFLPATEEASDPGAVQMAQTAGEGRGEVILVVEDEEAVRRMIHRILERNGYAVLEASEPREALDLFVANASQISLVLTDVVMPHMSGKDLVEILGDMDHRPQVLYMSGYPEDEVAHQGLVDEGVELIQKPFTEDALLKRIFPLLKGVR